MKYQCPYCDSFDVRKNKKNEVVCFECFSICSLNDEIDIRLNSRTKDAPPPFPVELERPRNKRAPHLRRGTASQTGMMTNVVHQ